MDIYFLYMFIHVVVTHFTEPWDNVWNIYDFMKRNLQGDTWEMIVYHRNGEKNIWNGPIPFNTKIIDLPNLGRESYVVHYHIYHNYDSLPDSIMFIPANIQMRKGIIHTLVVHRHVMQFLPPPIHTAWEAIKDLTVDKWHGATDVNRSDVEKQPYTLSPLRPFGKWYTQRIPVPFKDLLVYFGTFSVPRANILRYTREQYKDWLDELHDSGPNPEIGHYWERSWYSMFC